MGVFLDINREADKVHVLNEKWWLDLQTGLPLENRNRNEMLMLAISELSEALEGRRKKDRPDDKLPQYPQALVELADCMIRLLDVSGGCDFQLYQSLYSSKSLEYNGWSHPINFASELFGITKDITRGLSDWATYNLYPRDQENYAMSVILGKIEGLASWSYGADLFLSAYNDKNAYNQVRVDHTLEHRRNAPDGKLI